MSSDERWIVMQFKCKFKALSIEAFSAIFNDVLLPFDIIYVTNYLTIDRADGVQQYPVNKMTLIWSLYLYFNHEQSHDVVNTD